MRYGWEFECDWTRFLFGFSWVPARWLERFGYHVCFNFGPLSLSYSRIHNADGLSDCLEDYR